MPRPSEDDLIARYLVPLAGPGGLALRDDAAPRVKDGRVSWAVLWSALVTTTGSARKKRVTGWVTSVTNSAAVLKTTMSYLVPWSESEDAVRALGHLNHLSPSFALASSNNPSLNILA